MARNFRELICVKWPGGRGGLATDLGVSYEGARAMVLRNNINVAHWPTVLKAARRHRIPLTTEDLLRMAKARRRAIVGRATHRAAA